MLKRCFDVAVSICALIIASPVILIAACMIWIESGRPIFFTQERIGRGFVPFRIIKLRSMITGTTGPLVTCGGDQRITKVGRLLRATKMDELPQFFNVLRGDMSVVGPRPEVSAYVELFRNRYKAVLAVRPGITDLASILYRDEEQILASSQDPVRDYEESVLPRKLDLAEEYVRTQSLWLDCKIILQTAKITAFGGRAPETS
jgi:lipopolysaccharide/colanic/teichoic acid biosynthesis glycosyltransferase